VGALLDGQQPEHAILWQQGRIVDLTASSNDPSWKLIAATAVNDTGQIAGYGYHDGHRAAFLLTRGIRSLATSTRQAGSESVPFGPVSVAWIAGWGALDTAMSTFRVETVARSASGCGALSSRRSMRHPPGASLAGCGDSFSHSMKKGNSPP